MKHAAALFFLIFMSMTPSASAVPIDPDQRIRPDLLKAALDAAQTAGTGGERAERLVVVDYSRHSREERLFVINMETGGVTAYRASHGRGSDGDHDGYLDSFSSVPGSEASPRGTFRIAEEYYGKHGRSVRLDGLEETNRTARDRAIVIHAADYAEPEHLARYGKLGRSNGCIVFSRADLANFLEDVREGALIFVNN